MKHTYVSQRYGILLSCLLFWSPFFIKAEAISDEVNQVVQNIYICLDEGMSDIAQLTRDISLLDTNVDSPIHLLKRHLENGYLLGLHDEIVGVLEYAYWFMNQQEKTEDKQVLAVRLERVIDQVINGALNMTEEDVMRSPHLRLLTVNERMIVKGKTIFDNIVVMEKKLRVHGKARFYEDVKFKDEVTFEDDVLFEEDVTIEGTLTVNNITVLSCFDSLCVNNLSVVDEVITGTLSANDVIITGDLSVQNEVIGCDL